jgi:hypothetical protein
MVIDRGLPMCMLPYLLGGTFPNNPSVWTPIMGSGP